MTANRRPSMAARFWTAAAIRPSEVDVVLEERLDGPCHGALSGSSTGAHEAVELPWKAVSATSARLEQAVDAINGARFETIGGMETEDQIHIDRTMNRARRHAPRAAPRQRDPRRVAGRLQGSGGSGRTCRLTAILRRERACAARSDDEHPQWRRPCRQPRSTSRNSYMPIGRNDVPRGGCAGVRRSSTR